MLLFEAGAHPRTFWIDARMPLLLFPPWLALLPVLGALGAWWSSRGGGSRRTRLLAGVFPVAPLMGAFLLVLPIALLMEPQQFGFLTLKSFSINVLNWILIPGAALLVGALPFAVSRQEKA